MDERERRIGLNEALFREVNEAVSGTSLVPDPVLQAMFAS